MGSEGGGAIGSELPLGGEIVITNRFGCNGVGAFLHTGQTDVALCIGGGCVDGALVALKGEQAVGYGTTSIHGLNGGGMSGGVPHLNIVNKPIVDITRVVTPSTETNLE